MTEIDNKFMRRCLELAREGSGFVSPNPMVGCVIVKNGRVVSEGYHERCGELHAERIALQKAESSVHGGTMYVNLEPCAHFGKTPPCVDAVIKSGVTRVVVGIEDPNPIVVGNGIAKLRDAGIDVTVGVLEDECRELNKFFLKYITTRMPYVLIKIAQSVDGFIAGGSRNEWITSKQSRTMVHEWRTHYDAVLVGAGTVKVDNPSLTVRHVKGRNPLRVVVDGNLNSNPRAHIFCDKFAGDTLLVVEESMFYTKNSARKEFEKKKCTIVTVRGDVKGSLKFSHVFRALGLMGITSVMVEGGAHVFRKVLEEKLADELAVFISPKLLHGTLLTFGNITKGLIPLNYDLTSVAIEKVGKDSLIHGKIHY